MGKGFVVGFLVGVLVLVGGLYYYFASGMAPAAASDPPMPFERRLAHKALGAHIAKQNVPPPSLPADEPNLLAGAKVYRENCAGCHGLPGHTPPIIAARMFPHAPQLFRGKGVTDDPASESYWKTVNGIRLSGMPSYKNALTDTQLWQVALLVAHANEISAPAKKELMPEPTPAAQSSASAPATAPASKRK